MRFLHRLPLCVWACILLCAATTLAQQTAPTVRITNRIDGTRLVTLKGNVHPAATAKNDRGEVSPDFVMSDLVLVLSRSPEQQAAFNKFVAGQYDANSVNYHQWLQPDEVGEKFGSSLADISTISGWLVEQGLSVDGVSKDRMSIRFSGTAAQVENTFHTRIHNLSVKGVLHIANMTDPEIPAALSSVVVGVKALHNFVPHPLHRLGGTVSLTKKEGKWRRISTVPGSNIATEFRPGSSLARSSAHPQFGVNDSAGGYLVEDITPYDFATIYNVLPLWNNNIDGTGQTIAIAGTSLINASDVTTFRSSFGLPVGPAVQQINANNLATECTSTSPTAICSIGDLEENTLDVEWSGAVAKGAQVVLVVSGLNATQTNDAVYDSSNYVVSNKTANILNVSYGLCELALGTTGNVAYYNLWQSAASEGIAVFVAAGDSGSPSCDAGGDFIGNPYSAQDGLSVSGIASTPFNTAVGGTDFTWCKPTIDSSGNVAGCPSNSANAGPYWNVTNNATTGASATGYIPEIPWNDTCTNPIVAAYVSSIATYFGISGVTDTELSCNFIQQDWFSVFQTSGVALAPYIDTIGGGGGASNCVANTTSGNTLGTCTSSSTTTGAANGSIPLFNDGWTKPSWQAGITGIPSDGVRDIPDVSFFASNGMLNSAYLICVSALGSCTYSVSSENFAQEVGGTSVASPAMAGTMALINQKAGAPQGNPNAQLYALASQQTYSNCSSENGSTSSSCYFNDVDNGTIDMPCDYGASLGGLSYNSSSGSYVLSATYTGIISPNCAVQHASDTVGLLVNSASVNGYDAEVGYDLATGLGSLNIANVVNAFKPNTGSGVAALSSQLSAATIAINNSLTVTVTVTGSGSLGVPSGSVQVSGGGYISSPVTLTSGTATIQIPANSFSAGTDTLSIAYSGDTNYAPLTKTESVIVTVMTPVVAVTVNGASLNVNNPVPISVTVTGPSGATSIPTGTVSISGGSYTSGAVSLTAGTNNATATITIPAGSLTAGSYTLTVSYSGDAKFAAATGTVSTTLTGVQLLMPTVTVTPASTNVNSNASLNVATTITGSGATPTGTVTLSGGGLSPALTGSLTNGSYQFTVPANSLTVGPDTLFVAYSGDGVYAAGSGTASVTVAQSTFTMSQGSATISSPGGTGQAQITVSSSAGYSGTVTFTCVLSSGPTNLLPTNAPTCTGPSSVTLSGGGSQTATFTVTTAASMSELVRPGINNWIGSSAALALVIFFWIPSRRRKWRAVLGMFALILALGGISACGGGSSSSTSNPGTATGTYIFTVAATGSPAITPAPQTSISATVN